MVAAPPSRRNSSKADPPASGSGSNRASTPATSSAAHHGGSFLTKYFLVILFVFACLSLFMNTRFTDVVVQDTSILEQHLEQYLANSVKSLMKPLAGNDMIPEDDDPQDIVNFQRKQHDEEFDVSEASDENPATNQHIHRVAGLNCEKWGGPSTEAAQEMVYWEDIPTDAEWVSPFHRSLGDGKNGVSGGGAKQYMTFEPDHGGWNNIRMAMETVMAMAFAMGRTLVLPPHQRMYLLTKKEKGQRDYFSFEHFFHMERISEEHVGLDIISMTEFLETVVMKGKLVNPQTKQPLFPPNNRTDWDGVDGKEARALEKWLRNNMTNTVMLWNPEDCMAAFPQSTDPSDLQALAQVKQEIDREGGMPKWEEYIGKPTPVNASPKERMKENFAQRKDLCLYSPELQQADWVHFPMDHSGDMANRLLVHFYAFLFFQDWKQDLWMKRFVRDHVRYIDEIQCAAARVVAAIRNRVQLRTGTNGHNDFDTIHIRRGDFQYTVTRFDAPDIYEMVSKKVADNNTIYIATDERKKEFFQPLKDHYDVVFLDDFQHELEGVNTNYYGMIDQLVASRGRIFYGCWFSTFTGYINRLRGYHADDHQTPGYEQGIVPSYYYALKDRFSHMQTFYPVKKSFYAREFPTSWRLLDTGLDE